jgi:signal transduction histidine kinase
MAGRTEYHGAARRRPAIYDAAVTSGAVRSMAVAGIGLALSAAVAVTPSVSFSYHAPIARAVLETTVTLVGALAALLCLGRSRRRANATDLVAAWAMAILALSYPLLAALPRAIDDSPGERFGKWALVCARVAAAGLLVAAGELWADEPGQDGQGLPRSRRSLAFAVAAAVTAASALLLTWRAPGSTVSGDVAGANPLADPLVAAIQLGAAVLFGIAALRFSQRSRPTGDRFVGWLSVGCALLAVASFDYALSPSLELAWLHTGDLFRAGAVVAVAIGAVEEILSYWSRMAELARSEERRALARDLHDGLAQELAFLVSQTQTSDALRAPATWRRQLQSAAERALADSRRSIRTLVSETSESFDTDLKRVATETVERSPTRIELLTDISGADATFALRDQESVVKILREALTNAVRHSHATQITVTLTAEGERTLRVTDNGIGFDPAEVAVETTGFGLVSMRERAGSLGATFCIDSAPGFGTTVEMRWL